MNFKVEDKEAMMKELARKYSQGQVDDLDGMTVQFKDWWFNCPAQQYRAAAAVSTSRPKRPNC